FRVSVGIGQAGRTGMARCRDILPIITLGWIAHKKTVVDGIFAFADENEGHGWSGLVQIRILEKITRAHAGPRLHWNQKTIHRITTGMGDGYTSENIDA